MAAQFLAIILTPPRKGVDPESVCYASLTPLPVSLLHVDSHIPKVRLGRKRHLIVFFHHPPYTRRLGVGTVDGQIQCK